MQQRSSPDRTRRGRVHPAILVLLAAIIGGVAFWAANRETPFEAPTVDLSNAAPGVAEKFRAATEALREDDTDGALWGRVGAILDVNGLEVEAVPFYRRASTLDPGNWLWPYCLGVCLRTSDVAAAADAFQAALGKRADYLPLMVSAGLALEQSDRLKEAERWFTAALRIDQRCAPAMEGLAALALRKDDLAAAAEHLTRAVRAAPGYAPAWRMLAQVHDRKSEPDRAKIARRRASRGTNALPMSDPARATLAKDEGVLADHRILREQEFLQTGRPLDAIADWRDHLKADGASAVAHKRLCALLVGAGRDDEAKAEFAAAVEAEPQSADPYIAYGVALTNALRFDEAEQILRAGLKTDNDSVMVRVHLGALLCRDQRFSEGVPLLEQAALADPENSDALYNLGASQLDGGATKQAAATLGKLADLQPNHSRVFDQWAFALMKLGDEAKAESVLRQGLRESPFNVSTVNRLTWLLATAHDDKIRDPSRALNAATRLNDPRNARPSAPLMDTLAAAYAATGDFENAVKTATEAAARALNPTAGPPDPKLAERIQARIQSYRRKQPWRGLP